MLEPATTEELRDCIRGHEKVVIQGGGSKQRLAGDPGGRAIISTRRLTGVIEYKPDEYVFTAMAGTRLAEIRTLLAQHRQYLPCDPPLVAEGATLGGAVAAGLNGPGSFRFGGLRDFILGVRFVDGAGRLIMGGGKVVKNAAGFDFPKLMVGSLGRLGALAEITMKVFPEPPGLSHLRLRCSNLAAATATLNELSNQPWDLDALELIPATSELKLRLRGEPGALDARSTRIAAEPDPGGAQFWDDRDSLRLGMADDYLAKIPITPARIAEVAAGFPDCVISIGGNVAWAACASLEPLHALAVPALVVRGRSGEVITGNVRPPGAIHAALKDALDPGAKFPPAVMV